MIPPDDTTGAPSIRVEPITAAELLPELPAAPAPAAAPSTPAAPPPADAKRDSLGRLFDAEKFLPEPFDSKGRWRNAKAGRRKSSGASASAAPRSAGPVIDIPEIGPGEAPPPRPGAAPTPEAPPPQAGGTTPGAADAKQPAGADAHLSPEAAGGLAARVLYTLTGVAIGDHKAATATGDEHKAVASTFGEYFRFRGVALVGGLALGATVLAYLLADGRREPFGAFVKGLFKPKPRPEKRAEPINGNGQPAPASGTAPEPATASTPRPVHFPQ